MNDVLFDFGATILAGVRVVDPAALMRCVMQGGKTFDRLEGIEPVVRQTG